MFSLPAPSADGVSRQRESGGVTMQEYWTEVVVEGLIRGLIAGVIRRFALKKKRSRSELSRQWGAE